MQLFNLVCQHAGVDFCARAVHVISVLKQVFVGGKTGVVVVVDDRHVLLSCQCQEICQIGIGLLYAVVERRYGKHKAYAFCGADG